MRQPNLSHALFYRHAHIFILYILMFLLVELLGEVTTVRVSGDALKLFGLDKDWLRSFTEEDLGEDRS